MFTPVPQSNNNGRRCKQLFLIIFSPFFAKFSLDPLLNIPEQPLIFRQLNWKDLSTQFQIQKALMVYKTLNDLVPGYLSSKFVKRYARRCLLRDS